MDRTREVLPGTSAASMEAMGRCRPGVPATFIVATLAVVLAACLTGCPREPSLSELTARALAATRAAGSYRATALDIQAVNGEASTSRRESEFVAPDRFHSRTVTDDRWFEAISIGDTSYLRSSRQPDWCRSPCEGDGYHSQVSPIPLDRQLEPLDWLVDLHELPGEDIDGVPCRHYRGTVDQDAYVDALREKAGAQGSELVEEMRSWSMAFELWVDGSSCLIRQIKGELSFATIGPDTGEEIIISQVATTRFSDFDADIRIEAPPVS